MNENYEDEEYYYCWQEITNPLWSKTHGRYVKYSKKKCIVCDELINLEDYKLKTTGEKSNWEKKRTCGNNKCVTANKRSSKTAWQEDEYNQVKHCRYCQKPILLVDWMRNPSSLTLGEWKKITLCLGKGGVDNSSPCRNHYMHSRLEEQRYHLDRNKILMLFNELRESLNLSKADTESTFDGWELCLLSAGKSKSQFSQNEKLIEIYKYCVSLKRSEGFYNHLLSKGVNKSIGFAMFLFIFKRVCPEEFNRLPLWILPPPIRTTLITSDLVEDCKLKPELLFEKMKKDLFSNPTYDDYVMLSGEGLFDLRNKYAWLPTYSQLQRYESLAPYNERWEFVKDFQRYVSRDNKGRFTKFTFTNLDYQVNTHWSKGNTDMTHKQCIEWFFEYLCKHYALDIQRDNFPYRADEDELQQVINLVSYDLTKVKGCSVVQRVLGIRGCGIRVLVESLWPDYKIESNLWNRMSPSEKRMCDMIDRALKYNGINDLIYNEAVFIPTRTGKNAKYAHSNMPMKIDFISKTLGLIGEGQGDYHYIMRTFHNIVNDESLKWESRIPSCYNGSAETFVEYKQEQDVKCRRAIVRHGFHPIYVILSRFAYPVKGVHGDIPEWNRRYLTFNSTKRIGLAETFDMQGRKDIGDMIREYYYDVVMNAAASS
jgi:hypothetical protein